MAQLCKRMHWCAVKFVFFFSIELLVIDESDNLFDPGFNAAAGPTPRAHLAEIYQACTNTHLTCALFSATFSDELKEWCILNLDNVAQVYVGAR